MKYGSHLYEQAVSEWRDSYIDYNYLKIFIKLLKIIVQQLQELTEQVQEYQNNEINVEQINQSENKRLYVNMAEIMEDIKRLEKIGQSLNILFIERLECEVVVCKIFCQIKFEEIVSRFEKCKEFERISDKEMKANTLVPLLAEIYVETSFLNKMIKTNTESENKILKKYKKYSNNMFKDPPLLFKESINIKPVNAFTEKIENYYVDIKYELSNKQRKKNHILVKLRKLVKKPKVTNKDSLELGFLIGIIIAVIGFMSFLLAYSNKSVETDPIFSRDFPIWRGSAFIILYIWIIGIDVYFFEKNMVSHRIIFDMSQKGTTSSNRIFNIAGLFSAIFVIIFTAYALQLSDYVFYDSRPHRFLGLIVWVIMLVVLINPFPIFYHHSRFFLMKLFLKVLASPLIGVPFFISWTTDQFVSLVTPFEDFSYTICYYTKIDFANPDFVEEINPCRSPVRTAIFVYGCVTFGYRIVESLRQAYDNRKFIGEHQFYNSIKYSFSLLTVITAYKWRGGISSYFPAWLTFAIISTLYSYYWDLKVDWKLLNFKSKNFLLRDKLTYKPRNYYLIMISNFLLRVAWVATISQNVTDRAFGSPELFRLVTGSLEIFRRGIWNLLRIEKEQLKNAYIFKAVHPRQQRLENRIDEQINQNKNNSNPSREKLESPQELNANEILRSETNLYAPPPVGVDECRTLNDVRIKIEQNYAYKEESLKNYRFLCQQAYEILKKYKFDFEEK